MANTRTLYTVIVVLLAGMLIASSVAALYVYKYDTAQNNANVYLSELRSSSSSVQTTSILLDFGNGTVTWHNDTQVQPGTNLYTATVIVAGGNVNATWYPQYGEHYVTGIDNVENSATESWFLWTHNGSATWQVASTGADLYQASDGTLYAWTFCNYNATSYEPDCTP